MKFSRPAWSFRRAVECCIMPSLIWREILMYPVRAHASPMQVRFTDIPAGWQIATALASSADEFSAENYDRLVDSPVEIGTFQESDFDEGGGHYRVVVDAEPADYDIPKIVSTLRSLVVCGHRVDEGSTLSEPFCSSIIFREDLPVVAWSMPTRLRSDISAIRLADSPLSLGDLTAHEFFHLWNVKRIRPQSLEPMDYTKENYTRALWFSEGATTTAGNIIQLRAGLLDEARYLRALAAEIGELERRSAHLHASRWKSRVLTPGSKSTITIACQLAASPITTREISRCATRPAGARGD